MARILGNKLEQELLGNGKYAKIFQTIKENPDLSAEMRESELIVYYKKGKILSLTASHPSILADGYYKKEKGDQFKETRNTLLRRLDTRPSSYFELAMQLMDCHGDKKEFTIQQNIANQNISNDGDYIVLDMEYQYKQGQINKEERVVDKTRIDLVAVEKETNDIVLFELKQGCGALEESSGLEDHINKTTKLINDANANKDLHEDIIKIWEQKYRLGLINIPAPTTLGKMKMMFIFAYFAQREKEFYDKMIVDLGKKMDVPKTIYFDLTPKFQLVKP
ncbi:MAG: hypothetical protein MJZ53_00955 [Paludibacteraceae bacterium]|nr:hypothetical protein [Paludibacteraceae bacterium]